MIDWIYILGFIAWVLLITSFMVKEYILGMFASFLFMAFGVYLIINGFENVADWVNDSIGIIHIFIGAYVAIRGSYEQYKNF